MIDKDFNNLITSLKEAGQIKARRLAPGRRCELNPLDVNALREKLNKSQTQIARMIGVSASTLQNGSRADANRMAPQRPFCKSQRKIPRHSWRPLVHSPHPSNSRMQAKEDAAFAAPLRHAGFRVGRWRQQRLDGLGRSW
jgi:putative transcriptional regulator